MNCIKCKEEIHAARLKVLPKTKVCVNCSTAEAVSCVDVIYHKTGNTIQSNYTKVCYIYQSNKKSLKLYLEKIY